MEIKAIDLSAEALDLLLPQFKGKNVIESILEGVISPYQETVDAAFDIVEEYDLDTTNEDILNLIGKLLNVPRGNESTEEYRQLIKTQILINRSTGSSKTLIQTLDEIVGVGNYIITEQFPAEVNVRLYAPQTVLTAEIINAILPIGVNGVFFQNPYDDKIPWELSEVDPDTPNPLSILPDVADLGTTDVVITDVIFT